MEDKVEVYKVPKSIMDDLYDVTISLAEYGEWLIERKDFEAVVKLIPPVTKLKALLIAITEESHPEISSDLKAIEDAANRAETPEELERMVRELINLKQMIKKEKKH